MEKSLQDKAIDFKGKKYVLISDRVLFFNENYPQGSITTEMISTPTDKVMIVKASITPDCEKPLRVFEGHSQAVIGQGYINQTSALENAETSAVGRALAFMGIGVIESIASLDEIHKAENQAPKDIAPPFSSKPKEPTEEELNSLFSPDAPAETCQTCGTTKIMGKKGLYCKPCFIKWANENKPKQ